MPHFMGGLTGCCLVIVKAYYRVLGWPLMPYRGYTGSQGAVQWSQVGNMGS